MDWTVRMNKVISQFKNYFKSIEDDITAHQALIKIIIDKFSKESSSDALKRLKQKLQEV